MTSWIIISFSIPLVMGYLILRVLWPGRRFKTDWLLKFSLAFGIGSGLASCVFFVRLQLPATDFRAYFACELAILLALAGVVLFRGAARTPEHVPLDEGTATLGTRDRMVLAGAFLLTVAGKVGAFLLEAFGQPHGDTDAWQIWNLRARFLFRAGSDWTDGLSTQLSWVHAPEYPLFLPLSVARAWTFAGRETVIVPILLGLIFTFGTVLLLYSALSILRNQVRGFLAGLALLGTPYFIIYGARQGADIPMAFFILAVCALFCLADKDESGHFPPILLAGIICGLAAWTKNEGQLLILAIIVARFVTVSRLQGLRPGLREARYFLTGLVPILAVVIFYKALFAPPNDIWTDAGGRALGRLLSPSRYYCVAKEFARQAFTFGRWHTLGPVPFNPVPLLAGYLFCFGIRLPRREHPGVATSFLALCIVFTGYFCVYLLTPYDLQSHMAGSCDRLFLQLWPSVLFLFFMTLPSPWSLQDKEHCARSVSQTGSHQTK